MGGERERRAERGWREERGERVPGGRAGRPAHLRVRGGGGTAATLGLVHQRGLEIGQIALGEGVLGDLLLLLALVLEGQHLVGGPQVVPSAAAQLRHVAPAAQNFPAVLFSPRFLLASVCA